MVYDMDGQFHDEDGCFWCGDIPCICNTEECDDCQGTGTTGQMYLVMGEPQEVSCGTCNGSGRVQAPPQTTAENTGDAK